MTFKTTDSTKTRVSDTSWLILIINLQKTVETMNAASTLNSSGKTDEMIIYHQMSVKNTDWKVVKNLPCITYWQAFLGLNTCMFHIVHVRSNDTVNYWNVDFFSPWFTLIYKGVTLLQHLSSYSFFRQYSYKMQGSILNTWRHSSSCCLLNLILFSNY